MGGLHGLLFRSVNNHIGVLCVATGMGIFQASPLAGQWRGTKARFIQRSGVSFAARNWGA